MNGHCFDDQGIDRTSGKKQEKHGESQTRHGENCVGGHESQERERNGGDDRYAQGAGVAGGIALLPCGGGETTEQCAQQTGNDQDCAKERGGGFLRHVVNAMQECWPPEGKGAQREGVGDVAQDGELIIPDREKLKHLRPFGLVSRLRRR